MPKTERPVEHLFRASDVGVPTLIAQAISACDVDIQQVRSNQLDFVLSPAIEYVVKYPRMWCQ